MEIRATRQVRQVSSRALERAERHVLPHVPAHLQRRIDRFDLAINGRLQFVAALNPQIFPRQRLRIFQQQPPERRKIAVARRLPGAAIARERFQLVKPAPRPLHVNATRALLLAKLTEARHVLPGSWPPLCEMPSVLSKPALPLEPHMTPPMS